MNGVTADFVESFENTTDFSGVFFRMILNGVDDEVWRPEGLDYDDPKVKAILAKARQQQEVSSPPPPVQQEPGAE